MENFNWSPVYREIIRLKEKYVNQFGPSFSLYDNEGYDTFIDKWIDKTQDNFWVDIRPFIILKQYKTAVLFKYAKLNTLHDLLVEKGISDITEIWEKWDGFLQSCRSITIDLKNETILTPPFDKFFNIDELPSTSWDVVNSLMDNAKEIEFSNKLDGSICICRYLGNDDYFITSSGSVDPDALNSTVLRAMIKKFYSFDEESRNIRYMVRCYPEYTFMFEYIALDNQIVVKYQPEDEGFYLIGIRNNNTGDIFSYKEIQRRAIKFGVRSTTIFNMPLSKIMGILKKVKATQMEGIVINIDKHLFKLKADDYVQIHRILSKISAPSVIIKAIADGIYDDLLSKVPTAYREDIEKIADIVFKYDKDMNTVSKKYYEMAPKNDRKEFMLWVNEQVPTRYQGAVRNIYLGKENNFLKKKRGNDYQYVKIRDINPDFLEKSEDE